MFLGGKKIDCVSQKIRGKIDFLDFWCQKIGILGGIVNRIVSNKGSNLIIIDSSTGEIVKELGEKDQTINIIDNSSLRYLHSLMVNKDNFVKVYKNGIGYDILDKMSKTDYKVLECLIRHLWNTNNICMYENGVILKPKHIIGEIRWI